MYVQTQANNTKSSSIVYPKNNNKGVNPVNGSASQSIVSRSNSCPIIRRPSCEYQPPAKRICQRSEENTDELLNSIIQDSANNPLTYKNSTGSLPTVAAAFQSISSSVPTGTPAATIPHPAPSSKEVSPPAALPPYPLLGQGIAPNASEPFVCAFELCCY